MTSSLISRLCEWQLDGETSQVMAVENFAHALGMLCLSADDQLAQMDDGPECDLYYPWKSSSKSLQSHLSQIQDTALLSDISTLDSAIDALPESDWEEGNDQVYESVGWQSIRCLANEISARVELPTIVSILSDLKK